MYESIIYYDFGMMEEIKSFTRERLLDLFYGVYEKDAKKVLQLFQHISSILSSNRIRITVANVCAIIIIFLGSFNQLIC